MKTLTTFYVMILLHGLSLNAQTTNPTVQDSAFYSLQNAYMYPERVYTLQLSHQHVNADTLDLSVFVNLEKLILSYDSLSSLPKGLPKLNQLKVLDLSFNNFTFLPEELAFIPNLEELYLNNDIYLDFDQTFSVINKITHLKRLHLDSLPNFSFPKNLQLNSSIEYLSMRFDGLDNIPPELKKFEHLKILDVEGNAISSIRRDFLKNKEIESLSLSTSTKFRFSESFLILSKETSLRSLTISNSSFLAVPEDISLLNNITSLSLRNNHLAAFPMAILNLKKLRTLDLSENDFRSLPANFGELSNLETLNLSGDNFLDFDQTADLIRYMPSLHLLQVDDYDFVFDEKDYWELKQSKRFVELFPPSRRSGKVHLMKNINPRNTLLNTPLHPFNAEGFGIRLGW